MREPNLIPHQPWEESEPYSGTAWPANDRRAEKNFVLSTIKDGDVERFVKRIKTAVCHGALVLLVASGMLLAPVTRAAAAPPANIAIGVAVAFGPPPLPYYAQPLCPGPGYIWTPGFWAWDPYYGYYWVPGTWVLAPFEGALWTPGYWGWDADGDDFLWYPGYWGPVVGFYGGIAYGYGYTGYGYEGGYWQRGNFYYNRAVNNVSTRNITNVYNRTVVNNSTTVSYNGGNGGVMARPTEQQMTAARQRRSGPVAQQERQSQVARADPGERASVNHGAPRIAATPRPGVFRGRGVVENARASARYEEPPVNRAEARPARTERSAPERGGWHSFGAPQESAPPRENQRRAEPGRTERQAPEFRPERQDQRSYESRPQRMNEGRPPARFEPPPRQQREVAPPQERAPRGARERQPEPPRSNGRDEGNRRSDRHGPPDRG